MNSKIVPVLLLVIASVTISDAVKCYQCFYSSLQPGQSEGCKGPNMDQSLLKSCPATSAYCLTFAISTGSAVTVKRDCSAIKVPTSCTDSIEGKSCSTGCSTDVVPEHNLYAMDQGCQTQVDVIAEFASTGQIASQESAQGIGVDYDVRTVQNGYLRARWCSDGCNVQSGVGSITISLLAFSVSCILGLLSSNL